MKILIEYMYYMMCVFLEEYCYMWWTRSLKPEESISPDFIPNIVSQVHTNVIHTHVTMPQLHSL